MSSTQVAILFLERDRSEAYGVCALADIWKREGMDVRYLFGTGSFIPADILFLHINLSVVPEAVLEFARRYPKVVNLHARDIRKRTFSTLLLGRDSEYRGEVMVKTDLNNGGGPEAQYHPDAAYRRACWWQMLRLKALNPLPDWKGIHYPVFPSLQDVPKPCWKNQNWVVEKFLPERIEDHYVIRNYRFFGKREMALQLSSEKSFIRETALLKIEEIEPEPQLREFRGKLKMDYGKIDYVMIDGQPVIFDINKTMGSGRNLKAGNDPTILAARKYLAAGLFDYLD